MKFKDKYNVNPEFEELLTYQNKKEELEHEAKMIMFRFLGEIERLISPDKKLKKKELAKKIGVSASYITQLYKGEKLANLSLLAKLQDIYNLTFEVSAKLNTERYAADKLNLESIPRSIMEKDGFWVWHSIKKPDYTSEHDCCKAFELSEDSGLKAV